MRRAVGLSSHGASACYHRNKISAEPANPRINLLGKSVAELRAFMQSVGEPTYRGAQLYHALICRAAICIGNDVEFANGIA